MDEHKDDDANDGDTDTDDEDLFSCGKQMEEFKRQTALKRPAVCLDVAIPVVLPAVSSVLLVDTKKAKIGSKQRREVSRIESMRQLMGNHCMPNDLVWVNGFGGCRHVSYPCRYLTHCMINQLNQNTKDLLEAHGLLDQDVVCYFVKGEITFSGLDKLRQNTNGDTRFRYFRPGDEVYVEMCRQNEVLQDKRQKNAFLAKMSPKIGGKAIRLLHQLPGVVKVFDELFMEAKAREMVKEAQNKRAHQVHVENVTEANKNRVITENLRAAQPTDREQRVILSDIESLFELRVGDTILLNGGRDHARIVSVTPGEFFPLQIDRIIDSISYVRGNKRIQRLVPRKLAYEVLKGTFVENIEYLTKEYEVNSYSLLSEILEGSVPVQTRGAAALAQMVEIMKITKK